MGQDLFTASSSTGMVMVVVDGNRTIFRGYGETAPGSGVAPSANSLLRLCSLSKIFATDLLIQLIDAGTVRLDDPLQKFAPPHVVVPKRLNRAITLEDLATHTSGLPREVGAAPRDTPHFTFPGYAYRWHWLPTQRLRTTPGTTALYSNVGFDFLGDALSRASGKPYATLFADRIARPLGLHETGFTPNANECGRLLTGAKDEGPCTDTQNSAASAGVYSTATDMTRFLEYLLGDGQPSQDPGAQAAFIQPADLLHQQGLDHAGDVSGIGLGWMHLLAGDSEIIEKTGGGAGFTTYIALNHPHHIAIFVAFTDGETYTHYNVFKQTNNILLQLAGLPPQFDPVYHAPAPKPRSKRTTTRPRAKH